MKNVQDLLARVATSGQSATLTVEASRLDVAGLGPLVNVAIVAQVDGRRVERRVAVRAEDGPADLFEQVASAVSEAADDHAEAIKQRAFDEAEAAYRNERDRAAQAAEASRQAEDGANAEAET